MMELADIRKLVDKTLQPWFERAPKWTLSEKGVKTYDFICGKNGECKLQLHGDVPDGFTKITTVTEKQLHDGLTTKQWDRLYEKLGIHLEAIGLWQRNKFNTKRQTKIKG